MINKAFRKLTSIISSRVDWRKYILYVLFLIIVLLSYRKIFGGFFQHDEWLAFDYYMSGKENLLTFFRPAVSHYAPLTKLFFSLYVSVFQFSFFGYALLSILSHFIVVCLSFIFFSKLFNDKKLGLLASTFFAIEASGHQATSWVGADINTHGSTIFGLLAFIILSNTNFKKVWLAIIFLIVSLLFKEIALAFFILIPLMIHMFSGKKLLSNLPNYLKFVFVAFLYLAFRVSMIFFQEAYIRNRLITETQSFSEILVNIATFPAKIFAQSIFPIGQLMNLARNITRVLPAELTGLYGTTAFDIFSENITLQILNWMIFIIGIFLLVYVVKKSNNESIKKTTIFGFIFVILNSFIYVLSPDRSGNIPVVDSRNIYLPSLGAALFLISVVHTFTKGKFAKTFLVILPFLILNFFWLDKELTIMADRGTERKEILYQIKKNYPSLPKKTIFYMVSDTSFYGLPESVKTFPFEINLGYTLLVWYQPTEHFPKEFLEQGSYLYELTNEGYKEIGDRGFGYFWNKVSFLQAIKDNDLQEDSIIAFSYDSRTRSITDISSQIRKEIFQDKKFRKTKAEKL